MKYLMLFNCISISEIIFKIKYNFIQHKDSVIYLSVLPYLFIRQNLVISFPLLEKSISIFIKIFKIKIKGQDCQLNNKCSYGNFS